MTSAIAIFVKTPSLSPVKTRLAATIGAPAAQEFYRLSLKAIERTVINCGLTPFWAVGEEEAVNNPLWSSFKAIYTGEGTLGQRQHFIYSKLLREFQKVILIGVDAPQLQPDMIKKTRQFLESGRSFVFGPACDGGYYLFGGQVLLELQTWTSVPWSQDSTLKIFSSLIKDDYIYLDPLTDVDEEKDLERMILEMPEEKTVEQENIIQWYHRYHQGLSKDDQKQ